MKRKIIIVLTIILLTCACSGSSLKKINLKKLTNMLDKKETFVLYLTDESNDGNVLKKTLLKVSNDNNITTYYLNTEKINDDEKKDLKNILTFDETNIIVFIKKGTEQTTLSRIDDIYISKNNLKDELKIQGYIK